MSTGRELQPHRKLLVIPIVTALFTQLTACGGIRLTTETVAGTPSTAVVERWAGLVSDLRYVWTAESGIDVTSGPAVPTRAYVESTTLAQYMGSNDYLYPGYDTAVAQDKPKSSIPSEWGLWPNLGIPLKEQTVGSSRHHIIRVLAGGDLASVSLCTYNYLIADKMSDDLFVSFAQRAAEYGLAYPGVAVEMVKLRKLSNGSDSTSRQSGPDPAPTANVFGDWKIVGALDVTASGDSDFDTEWPTYHEELATCVDKAPDTLERRDQLVNGSHPQADFPTPKPTPGWPAN